MTSIKARLLVALGALSFLLIAISATGWVALGMANDAISSIFDDRVVPLRDLKVTSDMYAVNMVDAAHKVRSGALTWEQGAQSVDQAISEIDGRWSAYMASHMEADEKRLATETKQRMDRARGTSRSCARSSGPGTKRGSINSSRPDCTPTSTPSRKRSVAYGHSAGWRAREL